MMTEANRFFSRATLLASALLLSACASTTQWVNPARPGAQLAMDTDFCRVEGEGKLPKPEVKSSLGRAHRACRAHHHF